MQSRMTASQTCDKMDNLDKNFIWTQELEFPKEWEIKYNCLLFFGILFTSFTYLNTMVHLKPHLIVSLATRKV